MTSDIPKATKVTFLDNNHPLQRAANEVGAKHSLYKKIVYIVLCTAMGIFFTLTLFYRPNLASSIVLCTLFLLFFFLLLSGIVDKYLYAWYDKELHRVEQEYFASIESS